MIVDSFLFSEVFEKEVLLLKFILEEPCVDEWIILENAYSFQGEYKGLHVKDLIESDDRFLPFKERITIISENLQPEALDKKQVLDDKAFKVEFWQRDLAHDYFLNKYNDEDWIIISDVDEALDFTNDKRRNELICRMNSDTAGVLHVSTKRYWFDFDNEFKILYGIPMCTKKHLTSNNIKLHDVRLAYHSNLQMEWNNIIGFEYSSCFDAENIVRKLDTGSHMGYSKNDLKKALYCNHRVVSAKRQNTLKPTDHFFLDKVLLDETNSPKYVRDNLHVLKTNNIHPDYKENRVEQYPRFYSKFYKLNEGWDEKVKFINKKVRFLFRRLGIEKMIYE